MDYLEKLFGLNDKVALVTGGAAGVGRMIAEGLAHAGATVLITSRKGENCESAAAEINALGLKGSALGFAGDVSTEAGINSLVEEVNRRTDRLHILVNNAGKTWGASIEKFPYSAWESVERVNSAGPFYLTRGLLPLLLTSASSQQPARVINIGSIMGLVPAAENAYSYCASKAALHHLTKILAKEYSGKGITFNALALGLFPSGITAAAGAAAEGMDELIKENMPYGRLGEPDEVVSVILYLCGSGGSYTTGAVIPVDGGYSVQTGKITD